MKIGYCDALESADWLVCKGIRTVIKYDYSMLEYEDELISTQPRQENTTFSYKLGFISFMVCKTAYEVIPVTVIHDLADRQTGRQTDTQTGLQTVTYRY